MTLEERFYSKSIRNDETGCLEWTGCKDKKGYGGFMYNGKKWLAHRFAYCLIHGFESIPEGYQVMHKCHNRACIEGEHLKVGTNQDNQIDSRNVSHVCGQKLSNEDISAIRCMLLSRKYTQRHIADIFGVTEANISCIALGKSWTL